MSPARQVAALAGWELRTAMRSRWIMGAAAAFAALCVGVVLLGLRSLPALGVAGVGPGTAALLNLGVLVPPLIALLLGAGGLIGSREQGMLPMVEAQPVGRGRIVAGTFLGLAASVWSVLALGFGLAALIMSGAVRGSDLPALGGVAVGIIGATTAAVAIGVAVSSVSSGRLQALLGAAAVWFVLALGMDLALAGLAPALDLGPLGFLVAVLLNPLEGARILALLIAGGGSWGLGPFGAYLADGFGVGGAAGIIGMSLVAWTVLPLAFATWALRRR